MFRRNNTINTNAHECVHSRDTKCWPEVTHDTVKTWIASLAAGSLDGDTKTNCDDQQKIGETFPHLKSTKFSRPWFSQNRRQNFGSNSFHLNSIRCKHRHRCYNYIDRRRSTTKTEIFASVRNSHRTLQLAAEKHSFHSKCRFTISPEH